MKLKNSKPANPLRLLGGSLLGSAFLLAAGLVGTPTVQAASCPSGSWNLPKCNQECNCDAGYVCSPDKGECSLVQRSCAEVFIHDPDAATGLHLIDFEAIADDDSETNLDLMGLTSTQQFCDADTGHYASSCQEILDSGYHRGDGVYVVDGDGDGPNPAFEVFCDMTTDGGGWALVINKGENYPQYGSYQRTDGAPTPAHLLSNDFIPQGQENYDILTGLPVQEVRIIKGTAATGETVKFNEVEAKNFLTGIVAVPPEFQQFYDSMMGVDTMGVGNGNYFCGRKHPGTGWGQPWSHDGVNFACTSGNYGHSSRGSALEFYGAGAVFGENGIGTPGATFVNTAAQTDRLLLGDVCTNNGNRDCTAPNQSGARNTAGSNVRTQMWVRGVLPRTAPIHDHTSQYVINRIGASDIANNGTYPPFHLIDGSSATFNHTVNQAGNWAEVHLGNAQEAVSEIAVKNRHNCCGERLGPFTVKVLDANGAVLWEHSRTGTTATNVSYRFYPPEIVGAATVRVEQDWTNWLHLAEITVFGHRVVGYESEYPANCRSALAQDPSLQDQDGTYLIDPDGDGPDAEFHAYCDMTTAGGGWTQIMNRTQDWSVNGYSEVFATTDASDELAIGTRPATANKRVLKNIAGDDVMAVQRYMAYSYTDKAMLRNLGANWNHFYDNLAANADLCLAGQSGSSWNVRYWDNGGYRGTSSPGNDNINLYCATGGSTSGQGTQIQIWKNNAGERPVFAEQPKYEDNPYYAMCTSTSGSTNRRMILGDASTDGLLEGRFFSYSSKFGACAHNNITGDAHTQLFVR